MLQLTLNFPLFYNRRIFIHSTTGFQLSCSEESCNMYGIKLKYRYYRTFSSTDIPIERITTSWYLYLYRNTNKIVFEKIRRKQAIIFYVKKEASEEEFTK